MAGIDRNIRMKLACLHGVFMIVGVFCHASGDKLVRLSQNETVSSELTTSGGDEDERGLPMQVLDHGELKVFPNWPSVGCAAAGQTRSSRVGSGQVALYPNEDLTLSATRFMADYVDFLQEYLEDSALLAQSILKCQKEVKATRDCEPIHRYVREYLGKVLRVARFNLAMSGADGGLNEKLASPSGAIKEVAWKPLSADSSCSFLANGDKVCRPSEIDTARTQLANYERQAGLGPGRRSRWRTRKQGSVRKKLKAIRAKHQKIYVNTLSQFPILQYLSSHNPDSQEVIAATEATLVNNSKEQARLKAIGKRLRSHRPREVFNHLYLSLLKYRPFLDSFLWERPEFCNLAVDLLTIEKRRETIEGLMFVSFFAGSAVVVPAGHAVAMAAGGTAALGLLSHKDFREAKVRNFSVVQSTLELREQEHIGYSMNDVMETQAVFKSEVAMAPLGFISGGLTRAMILKAIRSR